MCALSVFGFLLAAATPGEWLPVHTNAIETWKTEHRAPLGVFADRTSRSVTFLAEATGLKKGETVEFFAIGPESDRAYESYCVTVAKPSDIASALESTGVPKGRAVNESEACFWPQGECVSLTVKPVGGKACGLADLVAEAKSTNAAVAANAPAGGILSRPLVFTGGSRGADLRPPCAVFSMYTYGQSQFLLDGRYGQSAVYGLFTAKAEHAPGTLLEVTVAWDGVKRAEERTIEVTSTADIAALAADLRDACAGKRVYGRLAFADDVPLVRASSAAEVFRELDGAPAAENGFELRMNGCAKGQFYYGAYLPDEKWRNRRGRLFQPFEVCVHHGGDGVGTFTFVEEDWSGPGSEPRLKPIEKPLKSFDEIPAFITDLPIAAQKISVMFVYGSYDATVGDLTPVFRAAYPRVDTFYVFRGL